MRWVVALLATLVGTAQVVLFLVAERQVQSAGELAGTTALTTSLRWVWLAGWTVPWLVGAVLIVARRARAATAVLLTSSVLLLAAGVGAIAPALVREPFAGLAGPSDVVERFGGVVVWVLALATAVATWLGRPRGDWRRGAPGPVGWYVALAVLAWLPSVFRTTELAPPGAPRRFVEADVATLTGLAEVASYMGAVALAGVLWVAPRLRRDVAGIVLLTYAVPTLLADLGDLVRVGTQEFVILTPTGVLGRVGVTGLVVAGAVWCVRRDVSDAATDPGRRPAGSTGPVERDPG